jgi:hypothetical protein
MRSESCDKGATENEKETTKVKAAEDLSNSAEE